LHIFGDTWIIHPYYVASSLWSLELYNILTTHTHKIRRSLRLSSFTHHFGQYRKKRFHISLAQRALLQRSVLHSITWNLRQLSRHLISGKMVEEEVLLTLWIQSRFTICFSFFLVRKTPNYTKVWTISILW
jgi:hypothetical protein